MPYAVVENGAVTNVIVVDAADAAAFGATLVSDEVGIGWTTTDGATWTPPAPPPGQAAVDAARGTIASLFSDTSALMQQIQSDAALFSGTQPNADGSYTFTAEHFAAWTRAVNGFATVMQAIEAHLALTGNLP